MKYCTYCGRQLDDREACTCEGAQASVNSKMKKADVSLLASKKKLLVPAMATLSVLIVLIVVISGNKNTLHLEDYILIEGVTGTDGNGVLEYSLDEASLTNDMFGDLYEKDLSDEDWEATLVENFERQAQVDNALDCITLSADPETGLSTGDKVTVKATFKNTGKYKFDFKFKDGSKTYTVDSIVPESAISTIGDPALSDSEQNGQEAVQLTPIDPFAEGTISVTFTGVNGVGTVVIEVLSAEEAISCFNYWSPDVNSLLGTGSLSNGDTITVKADFWAPDLNALGYAAPENSEKTYTVTGLAEYYDLSNGVPDDLMVSFCDYALSLSKEKDTANNPEAVSVPTVVKAYTMVSIDPACPYYSYAYDYYLINGVSIIIHSTVDAQQWHIYIAPNFTVDSEGNVKFEGSSILSWSYSFNNLDEAISWLQDSFYDMEIIEISTP